MFKRIKGWQAAARDDMSQVLLIDERGRHMLQNYNWKPMYDGASKYAYASFVKGHLLGK